MTKRIIKLFLLLVLAGGYYVMTVNAKGRGVLDPVQTLQPSQTATLATCKINTGIESGAVNLRTCPGIACAVIQTLTEGESLNILAAGTWARVATEDGVTGFLNSTYCKGK
jgi:uncharacterized protein YgiM (DUF1202 family)